jgi:hypothetical protein
MHGTVPQPVGYIYAPLMAFPVLLITCPSPSHSNRHARNHQCECFLGGRSRWVLRCHRVRTSLSPLVFVPLLIFGVPLMQTLGRCGLSGVHILPTVPK